MEECRRGAYLPFLGLEPYVDEPLDLRPRDARPTVTFPVAGLRPLTGTKLYCLVTEAQVCEQFAQGHHLKAERPRF